MVTAPGTLKIYSRTGSKAHCPSRSNPPRSISLWFWVTSQSWKTSFDSDPGKQLDCRPGSMNWSNLVSVNAIVIVWLWLQISIILYCICGNHPYTLSFRRDDSYYHNLNASDYAEHRKATKWVHDEIKNLSKRATNGKLKVQAPICLAIPTVLAAKLQSPPQCIASL